MPVPPRAGARERVPRQFVGIALVVLAYVLFACLDTTAISFLAPFFVTALVGPILDEWAGPRRWAAILVGSLDALFIVRPGRRGSSLPSSGRCARGRPTPCTSSSRAG